MNAGKLFEQDFQKSAEDQMVLIRLYDPAASFNSGCEGCPKKKTRFSPQNLCDYIGFHTGTMYLFELKSFKGKSISFKNIVKNAKDKRLEKMAAFYWADGVEPFYVFNLRDVDNETYAVDSYSVENYINEADRKSIPYNWIVQEGIEIGSKLKRVRYSYDIDKFLFDMCEN